MSDLITAADEAVLRRRGFLRGGALLAAAAGGAVAATASSVLPASAGVDYPSSLTIPIPPERLLDTRSDEGLKAIVASSEGALDSKNRLRGGAWIDVAIGTTDGSPEAAVVAVFVNLKSLASTKGGSLVVSQPTDERPTGTTVTYRKNETTTNSAFVGLGSTGDFFTVRIWATSTTHVTLDLTGAELFHDVPTLTARAASRTTAARVLKSVRAVGR